MTITPAASAGRITLLDRVVRWALDAGGDIYGDERERLRWYEGIATAASIQWIALPWAAAVLVWILGRPAVLPLAVMLAVLYVPMILCVLYVRRRRVEPPVLRWTPKRFVLEALSGPPILLFIVGCLYAFSPADLSFPPDGTIGGLVGGVIGAVGALYARHRRCRRAAAVAAGDDE